MDLESLAPARWLHCVRLEVLLFPALTFSFCAGTISSAAEIKLTPSGETTVAGFVEITDVEAGKFNPTL